jgi:lipoprotein-anchoring transpeptidase ErfK/SrfK
MGVMLSVFAAGLMVCSDFVHAQADWSDRGPAFESDLRQQAEQQEAERAERRKSYGPVVYPKYMEGGERPDIKPVAPPIVYFDRAEEVGSIIIDTQARKLYYILPNRQAYEYTISVGREGFSWTGTERISRIASWPSWTPPPEMHERVPGLPLTVSGGMQNPQGARALYLGNTVYRIHGTNNERTVGKANSSGCFRLTNENVVHLASIAKVGTKVRVLHSYEGSVSPNAPLSSLFDFGFLSSKPSPPASKTTKPTKSTTTKKSTTPPAPAQKTAAE